MPKALIVTETPEERAKRLHDIRVANGRKRAQMPDFKDAQRAGGKTRASQPDFIDACRKGFQTTMYRYPEFGDWLSKRITRYNDAKGAEMGISGAQYRRERIKVNGSEGLSFSMIAGEW